MAWMRNLSVRGKLIALTLTALIFLVGVGITGYYYLQNSKIMMERMYSDNLIPVELLNENRVHARAIQADMLHLMITTDDNENKRLLADVETRAKTFNQNLERYEQMKLSSEERKKLDNMKGVLAQYRDIRANVIQLALANKNVEAYQLYMHELLPVMDSFLTQLREMSAAQTEKAEADTKHNDVEFGRATWTVAGIIVLAAVITMLAGWLIARMILQPLQQVNAAVQEVAAGNLAVGALKIQSRDEVGQVAQAVNRMLNNLRELITKVNHSVEQVAASSQELTASTEQTALAAGQVAQSVTEVAHGAERQLMAVGKGAASVQRMLKGIGAVESEAKVVAEAAGKASAAAGEGEGTIHKAVEQMAAIETAVISSVEVVDRLGKRSQEIGQIVATISGIASQTNLLALNAAIEAARAGDQGRGFAVVADEVRKLAEQSQEAAKQIAKMIGDIQSETGSAVSAMMNGKQEVLVGTEIVNHAGQAFGKIAELNRQATAEVGKISAEIARVSSESREVNDAMHDIAAISKQTAGETQNVSAATEEQSATMEEISAASRTLAHMAEDMQSAIAQFQL